MAIARPPSDIRFADTPQYAMAMSASPMEIGTEISTRKVARKLTRNSINTITINTKASSKAFETVVTAWSTRLAWS